MSKTVSPQITQGAKANENGDAVRSAIADHLLRLGRLLPDRSSPSLADLRRACAGQLFAGQYRGTFVEDLPVCPSATFARPFKAQFVLSVQGWPTPVILFFNSQHCSGTAENAVLKFLISALWHSPIPALALFEGRRWYRSRGRGVQESPGLGWLRDLMCKHPRKILRIFRGLSELHDWLEAGMQCPFPDQQTFG